MNSNCVLMLQKDIESHKNGFVTVDQFIEIIMKNPYKKTSEISIISSFFDKITKAKLYN